ncbi:MFS transporter [Dactylosporangium sp. AC04546]|uniref:MFS transporter n=1 Tax=Dactylosporangium sp. AC04546 TaxID=2862460 RepID=UPI001EDDB129|nr:MFS transporter [Dactylosporangium sp. AC04546]WVK80821.1 MFS transporter [Dactylosporangium sp. AC04546]
MEALFGGPARTRVILLFAGVLAMGSADLGMVGALARELEDAFRIGQARLGLLATVSYGVGALATIPMGALADQVPRVRLLIYTVILWSVALLAGGAAQSYLWLLLSRLAMGGAIAAAGPLLASLTGDLIPATERAKVYGWILTGEMIGAGIGLIVGANIGAAASWRYGFWLLGLLGLGLTAALYRWLPEPARGGASQLPPGAHEIPRATPVRMRGNPLATPQGTGGADVLRQAWRSLGRAFAYILHIRTIRILIVASSVGYSFFAGLRTFSVVFVQSWYGVSTRGLTGLVVAVGAGALAGTVLGGRLADRLQRNGHPNARILVPAVAYTATALLFAPGLASGSVAFALPFLILGAATLGAASPPLDAARLDIVTPWLWGRAESARTILSLTGQALGPVCFGLVADALAGRGGTSRTASLRDTFLIMLVPLLANGLIMLSARHTYLTDKEAAHRAGARAQCGRTLRTPTSGRGIEDA